jgi:hypothetical protein
MAQTTQQPILNMEIIDNCIFSQHVVGGGASCFILDVEVELLQVCGPL